MTIGSVNYQIFPSTGFAIGDSLHDSPSSYNYARSGAVSGIPVPEGVNIDVQRVIDLLLDQLEQLSYHIAVYRTEPRTEPIVADLNLDAEIDFDVEMFASDDARLDALIDQYAQVRDYVETEGVSAPFAPVGPFAGMLFGVDA